MTNLGVHKTESIAVNAKPQRSFEWGRHILMLSLYMAPFLWRTHIILPVWLPSVQSGCREKEWICTSLSSHGQGKPCITRANLQWRSQLKSWKSWFFFCPWPRCCLSSSGSRGNMLAPRHSVLLSFSKEFSFTSRSPVQIQVRSVVIEITAVPALLRCTWNELGVSFTQDTAF